MHRWLQGCYLLRAPVFAALSGYVFIGKTFCRRGFEAAGVFYSGYNNYSGYLGAFGLIEKWILPDLCGSMMSCSAACRVSAAERARTIT